jgi:hypothetical protein
MNDSSNKLFTIYPTIEKKATLWPDFNFKDGRVGAKYMMIQAIFRIKQPISKQWVLRLHWFDAAEYHTEENPITDESLEAQLNQKAKEVYENLCAMKTDIDLADPERVYGWMVDENQNDTLTQGSPKISSLSVDVYVHPCLEHGFEADSNMYYSRGHFRLREEKSNTWFLKPVFFAETNGLNDIESNLTLESNADAEFLELSVGFTPDRFCLIDECQLDESEWRHAFTSNTSSK